MDANKTILETQISNRNGEVLYNAEYKKPYTLEVYKDGYITKPFSASSMQVKISIKAAIEPIDIIVTETEIVLNLIYFHFNKSDITERCAAELDKIVYVMSQNNTIKINVRSNTDSRGTDEYNLDLSERRAKSTVAYIISKVINPDMISGKGFVESDLKLIVKISAPN